ncbi:nitrate reductase [Erythrobacter insulae]|uniref:Nitrate reductase n=1 Tax=Erythrobacter insulae TaxID=2584124 RepID=A0A547PA70_9SPHN|nr:nitrate reductase [Erythrobacter insulae]TRD11035.1 nitrate reductase [Erythrobacter insulae]
MRAIKTTCAYCGVGCGIRAVVTGERSVKIEGDKAHPANRGSLCSKGTHLGETVGLEGRLLHPMIDGERATWEKATADIAARMQACIDEHGPDSVAFYVSGQLLTEDYYVANKLMKGFVGSGNIDTNSRLCMASAVAAHNRAFGEDIVPLTYGDLDHADVILLVGSNTAWCHPVIWQRIERAREANGTKLVVIDPRRTETAERADLHIPVKPDGDVALFNALLAAQDVDYAEVAARCELPEGFVESRTREHGIESQLFAELASMVASSERLITVFSQGANQSRSGTDKGNAIINLHLATGQINRRGAGPFSITGQPNAMGGREVGGLANMLACHLGFGEQERASVAEFWKTDRLCCGPGLKAIDMFEAIHSDKIKFLWVMATNPAVSLPNAGRVREALAKCPTVVVSDVMADTDTGRFAHILLPALGWGEKDGTVTNSERMVSRQRALFAAPGEACADWQIVRDVAHAMGHGAAFDFPTNASVFREYAAMTQLSVEFGQKLNMTAWSHRSDAQYEAMEPFRWGGDYPLASGASTPSGKPRLIAVTPPLIKAFEKERPFRLNTARYRDQWHTMTRTGHSPKLAIHRREPLVEIHSKDAQALEINDGDLCRVSTEQGESIFRAAVTKSVQPGALCIPMHWTDIMAGSGRTGRLASPQTDPISGQPGFKDEPANLKRLQVERRGFLVSRDPLDASLADYWVQSRVSGGWLYELACFAQTDLAKLLPEGAVSEVSFARAGMQRVAVYDNKGALMAALFSTRAGDLPKREWVAAQLGKRVEDPVALLAARPRGAIVDQGPVVCVCHEVGQHEIERAIVDGAQSLPAIGQCTRAGTNCGSCRPELARMIESLTENLKEAAE